MNRYELLEEVMKELQKVNINEEISTYELVQRVKERRVCILKDEFTDMMWLNDQIIKKAKKYGVMIDTSIHADEILGLAYVIGFLVKKNCNA